MIESSFPSNDSKLTIIAQDFFLTALFCLLVSLLEFSTKLFFFSLFLGKGRVFIFSFFFFFFFLFFSFSFSLARLLWLVLIFLIYFYK
jgi:hypothetical protein